MKNKLVCLIGKSASGKDALYKILVKEYGFKGIVSTTTRPKRSNETDHVDYHFVKPELFHNMLKEGYFVEYRTYYTIENGLPTKWEYGIAKMEIGLLEENQVVVCDLKGLQDLKEYLGEENVIAIYIHASDESRRLRAIVRDANFEEAEWQRRLKDDEQKFKDVGSKVNFLVVNHNLDECLEDILRYLKNACVM